MTLHVLKIWDQRFAQAIQEIAVSKRIRAGVLLPVVPDHSQWDDYLSSVMTEWKDWSPALSQYPSCLLVLYAGLAFYEYDENTLWPQFAASVGADRMPANQQKKINSAFAGAAKHFGLMLKPSIKRSDFVGSAVHHIGIPLSLWDGFLDICEWALWRKDWKTLGEEDWIDVVGKRAGGRQRLKRFLIDNRDSAGSLIQEMLEAREFLTSDPGLTIDDIAQASILRVEYFDEVPETAEFLRPQNPESLFQDRARLTWDNQRRRISLFLPAVAREKLPAHWRIGTQTQIADLAPDEIILNSAAFHNPLLLTLESGTHEETQRLRGLDPWGLFDLESGGRQVVNPDRDELPLKSYLLVSQKQIEGVSREEFDEDGNPPNEQFELVNRPGFSGDSFV